MHKLDEGYSCLSSRLARMKAFIIKQKRHEIKKETLAVDALNKKNKREVLLRLHIMSIHNSAMWINPPLAFFFSSSS